MTKTKLLYILLILIISFFSCTNSKIIYDFKRIPIIKKQLYENGKIKKIILSKDYYLMTSLGNLKFKQNKWITFYKNGNLDEGVLAEDAKFLPKIGRIIIKKNKSNKYPEIMFHKNGYPKRIDFEKNQYLEAHTRIGNFKSRKVIFRKNIIWGITLSTPEKVKIPIGQYILTYIDFDEDGYFEGAGTLNSFIVKTKVGEIKVAGNNEQSNIYFHRNGKVSRLLIREPQYIMTSAGKLKVREDRYFAFLTFYSNGNIEHLMLAENTFFNTSVGRVKIDMHTSVVFHDNGILKSASLDWNQKIRILGKEFMVYHDIEFYKNSKLKYMLFVKPETIKTPYGKHEVKYIYFYSNGRIQGVRFTKTKTVKTSIGTYNLIGIKNYNNKRIKTLLFSEAYEFKTPSGKLKLDGVVFYQNGKIKAGRLAKPVILRTHGKVIKTKKWIGWNKQSRVVKHINYNGLTLDLKFYTPSEE